jgi:2-aminoethylphosphonate-pyruvate transaminase
VAARLILLNPGPVTLSERVRSALTRADWCHREPEFAELTRDINRGLAGVYPEIGASCDAVLMTGSGTAAVEAMLASFAPAEHRTLVVANGVYGERMAKMLEAHGRPHAVMRHDWTEPVDVARLEGMLAGDRSITRVAIVHHETTTGRLNDLEAVGRVCLAFGARLLVDAVSSFGAEQIDVAGWNIAALAATANKCLHGAPGLSFVLARHELWRVPPVRPVSVYLDLFSYYRVQHNAGFSPFTQSIPVAFALAEALAELRDQGGWLARRELYRRRARRVAAVLGQAGVCTLLAPPDYSSVLWSYVLPAGLGYAALHDALKREGFVIYAGQGDLGARIFRIAHMGDIRDADLDRLCAALNRILTVRP